MFSLFIIVLLAMCITVSVVGTLIGTLEGVVSFFVFHPKRTVAIVVGLVIVGIAASRSSVTFSDILSIFSIDSASMSTCRCSMEWL